MPLPTPLDIARELLRFDTTNPPGQERTCAAYVEQLLAGAGLTTERFEFAEGRTTLKATLAGSSAAEPICFTGHLDVVPVGSAHWQRNPFGGECDGDQLHGRGASDMKSGIAAMMSMALQLAGRKQRQGSLVLLLTAGEETGLHGARHMVGLGREALGEAGALVVGEPTSNRPLVAHKGALRLAVEAHGIPAHASMPDRGESAIDKAADALIALRGLDFGVAADPLLGRPTLNVGTIAGGTATNIVPDRARMTLDIRTLPGQCTTQVLQRVHQALAGCDVTVRVLEEAAGIATDIDDPWIQQVFDIAESIDGTRPKPGGAPYFTDAALLKPAYGDPPTIIYGPGEAEQAHTTDECCSIARLERATEAYTEIAQRWIENKPPAL